MKIIIPMAGMGKRLRPHTLTVPKPLIKLAGKPIVQHLIEELAQVTNEKIEEIAFVIGDFGSDVENDLKNIAKKLNAKPKIYYQKEALGTAHAIYCAEKSLDGKVIIAFADTLFKTDFIIDKKPDSIIWVKKVKNPDDFGVVKLDNKNNIVDFIEKPKNFVSDLAIIGIYYFKDGKIMRNRIKHLLDNKIIVNGEYQLTDALQDMKKDGYIFKPGEVNEWLDCGNKNATVFTNKKLLEINGGNDKSKVKINNKNSIIIEPVYIENNVSVENSIIGPHVSLGTNTVIKNSIITNSIIQNDNLLTDCNIQNSMIGNNTEVNGSIIDISIGDYNKIKL
ncbi:MAG: hypothetical protein KAT68_07420 [Bacteroidales bacterium]|nr:hypothetical protein [Bacteroidales bacterium]